MVLRNLTFTAKTTLRRQLVGYFVVSVLIVSLFTSVITALQTSQKVKNETIKNGIQIANNLSAQSLLALITLSEENAQEAISRTLGFDSVIAVGIYKESGQLLVSSSKLETVFVDMQLTVKSNEAEMIAESEDFLNFGAPVIYIDEDEFSEFVDPEENIEAQQTTSVIGYVNVVYDKQPLLEVQRSIITNNISIAALVTVMLAIFMSFGINRLIEPLSRLSKTMENTSDSGDYSPADIAGASEVRQIAAVYNKMMQRLSTQTTELEQHRENLQSEVEIRTQELIVARDTALTANRHKTEFLANISHELRTPLQAIIGYTDLVKEDLEMECMDQQSEDLGKAIRSAHTLLGLINNILDLAKIEAGRMDLYIQSVNMDSLVNDTIETIEPMAKANGNQLKLERGSLSSTLNLDRQKMMQVFLNLLSNACKFTKNGEIIFSIENSDSHLNFSVKDTGIGIPKDKLDFIFQQFTQVDGSHTRKFEGTGLGMAITQSFCQMMGAEIRVESQEGKGSCFTVSIPLNFATT